MKIIVILAFLSSIWMPLAPTDTINNIFVIFFNTSKFI